MIAKVASICCVVFTLVAVAGHVAAAQQPSGNSEDTVYRTWTDSTGLYRTEAAMLKYANGQVHLQKADGSMLTVDIGKLSKADQRYLRDELSRRKTRPTTPRTPPAETVPQETVPRETVASGGGDWPGWRGPNRDGKSPDTGLLKQWPAGGPKLLWEVNDIGKGFSTVAVTGGTVYTTGTVGNALVLFAFDLEGNLKWKVDHDQAYTKSHPGSRSTPMIDGGNLYLVSGNGLVGCYNATTGKPNWSAHMRQFGGGMPTWGYAESVLILDNLAVITPGGSNCLVALDKANGRLVWSTQGFNAQAQYGSCYAFTHQGATMIVTGTAEGLVCVDPRSSGLLWSNPFSAHNTANCPTPAFSDGYVFWANGYGKGGVCMKLEAGGRQVLAQQAWTTKDMDCQHGGYVIHDGYIYGNHNNGWACLDLKTGRKMWEEGGVGKGSLCFADGMLYLFSESGGKAGLATCSPEGMQMKGEFSVQGSGPSWAHPVVIGGRLYLRYDTNLYCFDVSAG